MNTQKWYVNDSDYLEFIVYDSNENWKNVKGLYIFAKLDKIKSQWIPIYIGKTEDFSQRLPNHERLDEAVKLGASHIHAITLSDRSSQNLDLLERLLIQRYDPVLNTHHR